MTLGELIDKINGPKFRADRLGLLYLDALDAGDADAILALRRRAETDPELAVAIRDVADGLEWEREDGKP